MFCQKIYCLTISTGRLNRLLCFHRPPINLVIFKGSTQLALHEILSWRRLPT